jgi:hypothetical protein
MSKVYKNKIAKLHLKVCCLFYFFENYCINYANVYEVFQIVLMRRVNL